MIEPDKSYKLTEFNVFLFIKIQEHDIKIPMPDSIFTTLKKQFKIEKALNEIKQGE